MGKVEHNNKYIDNIYLSYEYFELGNWIHNLMIRAKHRSSMSNSGKQGKVNDLIDAKNYYVMLGEKMKREFRKHGFNFEKL